MQTRKISHPLPIILLGEEHWKKAINFNYLLECGMCMARSRALCSAAFFLTCFLVALAMMAVRLTQSHLDMLVFKNSAEDRA